MAQRHTILSVVGTRPNFMKVAPVVRELRRRSGRFDHVLVHTGQHYDDAMSKVFFEELEVPAPDHMLDVGSGTHAKQTALVMERLEPILADLRPDVVLVPGDVNSTMAATLVAVKLNLPVGHIEAGLRSFDRTMPEEINRIVTDRISDLLFVHSPEAVANLVHEGCPAGSIHQVGNTMIDTLVAMRGRIDALAAPAAHGLEPGSYVVVTLHRPALVDGALLADAVAQLENLARHVTVVFPAHPRTRHNMEAFGLRPDGEQLRVIEPLGYLEFLGLVTDAAGVLTDSGGIQEETTYLGVPCFTLRDNTERPVTCEIGTNTLLGLDPARIAEIPALLEAARGATAGIPEGWDGHAAERLVAVLDSWTANRQPAGASLTPAPS